MVCYVSNSHKASFPMPLHSSPTSWSVASYCLHTSFWIKGKLVRWHWQRVACLVSILVLCLIGKLDTPKRIKSPSSNSAPFCLIYFLLDSEIYSREDVIAAVMWMTHKYIPKTSYWWVIIKCPKQGSWTRALELSEEHEKTGRQCKIESECILDFLAYWTWVSVVQAMDREVH